jgi:uncharacterized protein (DUF1501 family)
MTRPTITRRHFLALTGGVVLAGCAGGRTDTGGGPAATSTDASVPTVPSSVPTTVTTIDAAPEAVPDGRVLVVVELAGGNDAVNTLVPLAGPSVAPYRTSRPTLALPESELVPFADSVALHPALAPLTALTDRMATIAGIGFADPDRSHFVSFDRWWRADQLEQSTGWLGRWLDTLPDDAVAPLGAVAVGRGSPVLRAGSASSTTIADAASFSLPAGIDGSDLASFGGGQPADPVLAAAGRAWGATSAAVAEFAPLAAASVDSAPSEYGVPATTGFQQGLALAAEIVTGDVGSRVVVVSVSGFDTHSVQLDTHEALLADLAAGISNFWRTMDDAGTADRVLMFTQSEFGRRVAENGSAGTDHGAAGVSFVLGDGIRTGVHGALDLTALRNGDVQPVHDPRGLFTAALDWLGGDVERVLGERDDSLDLLL